MRKKSTISKKRKLLGLFSVVRAYNLVILVIAQYLASIFIFSVDQSVCDVLTNFHLLIVVLCSVAVVSAGYIINDFYDISIDKINKPFKTQIGNWVSDKTKLTIYFILNFTAFALSSIVSWKATVFFSVYIFLIWLYSHKLKKYPIVKILAVSILDILPFFVIFVFHKNISYFILTHGVYLFFIMLIKEIVKDYKNDMGESLNSRETLAEMYSEGFIKNILITLFTLLMIPVFSLLTFSEIGYMKFYFYLVLLLIPVMIHLCLKTQPIRNYYYLHNLLKIIVLAGVFSLCLIDTSVLLIRMLNKISLL